MSAPNDDAANEAGGGGESTPAGGSGDSVNYDDVIDQTEEEEKARECNLLQSGVGNDKLIASGLIHGDEETGDSQIKEEVEENSRRIEDAHIQEFEILDASPPESAAASAQFHSSYDDDSTKIVGGEAGCDNDHRIDVHDHCHSDKSSNRYQDATYDKNLEECFPKETHSMAKLIAGDRDRPNAKSPSRRNRRLKAYFALGLVLIAVIATVVVVVTTMKLKEKYSSKEVFYVTPAPKESPTMAPKERDISGVTEFLEKNVLIGNKAYDGFQVGLVNGTIGNVTTGEDNFTAWNNLEGATTFADLEAGDPRLIALEWILHKDAKQLEVYDENLSQRYILGLLAVAWDSESWDYCGAVVENTTEVEVADTDWSEDSGTCITSDNATDSVQTYQRWLSDAHECDWYGVACKDGYVLSIELAQNNLIGEIVPELGMLRSLQIIDLSSNCIYGTLPSSIGQLSILNILDLKDNGLGGNIPEEFFNLTNLVKLDLSYNANNGDNCTRSDGTVQQRPLSFGFEGNILESNIGRLQLLLDIDLTDNYFSGSIAPQIGKLKQLGRLVIDNNVFNSFIPDEITQLINLKELWLSLNYFTGGIPENIGALKSLESFSMWGNEDLTGQIPDSLYNLTMLEDLHLFRNSFSGSISEQIGRLTKLKMLTLAENNFTGTLPTELGLCHDLEFLRIEMTNIEGSAPKEVCDLTDKNLFSPYRDEEYFKADCLEDNVTKVAFFVCDCCSSCCDHVTNQCIILD